MADGSLDRFEEENKMNNLAKKMIVNMAKKVAVTQANSSCAFWFYQPQQPKALQKLRKY